MATMLNSKTVKLREELDFMFDEEIPTNSSASHHNHDSDMSDSDTDDNDYDEYDYDEN